MQKVTDEAGLDAALNGKTIVVFHTTWCPFCRSFRPVFDRLTKKLPGVIEAVIDDEDNPLWEKYSIEIVPTVIFFDGKKAVRRLDGRPMVGLTAGDLEAALAS